MPQIADLVANLTADITKFKSGLTEAVGLAQSQGAKIASSLGGGALGFAKSLAGGALALGAAWGVTEAVAKQREARNAELRLQAVIENTGDAFGLTTEDVRKFAHEMQAATNIGHLAVIEAATALGRYREIGSGDVFKQALGLATDLAVVLDRDVVSTARTLGSVLQNPSDSFLEIKNIGVSLTEQQKQRITDLQAGNDLLGAQKIILDEIGSTVGGSAKAVAEPWRQITNLTHEIAENVGLALVPALDEVGMFLRDLIAPGVASTRDLFKQVGEYIRTWVISGLDVVRVGILAAGFAIEHWPEVAKAAFDWIGQNWWNVIKDMINATLALNTNIEKNLVGGFKAAFDYIASGGTKAFEFTATPLLDGFKSSLTEFKLPPALSDQWSDMLLEAMKKNEKERNRFKVPPVLADSPDKKPDAPGRAGREGFTFAKEGSVEALSTIFRNLNQTQSPDQQALAVQKAALDEHRRQTDLLLELISVQWKDNFGVDF